MPILIVVGLACLSVWFVRNLMWLHRKGRVSMWGEVGFYGLACVALGSAILFRNELRSVSIWLSAMCFWSPLFVMLWRSIRLTGIAENEALEEDGGLAIEGLEHKS